MEKEMEKQVDELSKENQVVTRQEFEDILLAVVGVTTGILVHEVACAGGAMAKDLVDSIMRKTLPRPEREPRGYHTGNGPGPW